MFKVVPATFLHWIKIDLFNWILMIELDRSWSKLIKTFFFFLLDAEHGAGQYTEKRIHLSNRLPSWIKSLVPKIFYITEKAWNYYPFTITEYTCSFVPRFAIHIQTKYLNDRGTTDNVSTSLGNSLSMLSSFFENLVNFYAKKFGVTAFVMI